MMESSNPGSLLSLPFNLIDAQDSLGHLCCVVSRWGKWVPEQGRVSLMPDFHQMGSVGQIPPPKFIPLEKIPFSDLNNIP